MKDKAKKLIDIAFDALHELSEDCATEANEWLAIVELEKALHEIRKAIEKAETMIEEVLKTFTQEIDNGNKD